MYYLQHNSTTLLSYFMKINNFLLCRIIEIDANILISQDI